MTLSILLQRTFGRLRQPDGFRPDPALRARALPETWAARVRQQHLWARSGQWLRYRDGQVTMADDLLKRGRGPEALERLLDAWFVDLNGPRNAMPPSAALLANEAPPVDPARGATHPRVQRQVRRIMKQLALEIDDVQALFFATAANTHRRYGLPLSPTRAWLAIGARLLD